MIGGIVDTDLLALDEALTRLAAIDPQQSRVVELRFFGGLTMDETAEVMHISPATVGREWRMAKAWLFAELAAPMSRRDTMNPDQWARVKDVFNAALEQEPGARPHSLHRRRAGRTPCAPRSSACSKRNASLLISSSSRPPQLC